jgi:hypothetical protein
MGLGEGKMDNSVGLLVIARNPRICSALICMSNLDFFLSSPNFGKDLFAVVSFSPRRRTVPGAPGPPPYVRFRNLGVGNACNHTGQHSTAQKDQCL